jgi:TrmH family RNA methyltransferase
MNALSRFRLVLVAPRVPGNVGSCARLAANFDCEDWVIVAPQCSWDGWDAKKLATGDSNQLLESVRVTETLEEAIQDCAAAVGFTRRLGRIRKPSAAVGELTALLPSKGKGKIALVFGNEETGLSRDELNACTHVCHLETSEKMASLNLSHAVGVVLARVFENLSSRRTVSAPISAATLGELDAVLDHWEEVLRDLGLTRNGSPQRLVLTLRQIFARARITARELRAVRGVLSKIQVKLGTRVHGKRVAKTASRSKLAANNPGSSSEPS